MLAGSTVKLLGEGGFSYVYLAQDPSSDRLFALKKIRCPLGSDSVREALKEVEAYRCNPSTLEAELVKG